VSCVMHVVLISAFLVALVIPPLMLLMWPRAHLMLCSDQGEIVAAWPILRRLGTGNHGTVYALEHVEQLIQGQ
jgi:hypothetical protein